MQTSSMMKTISHSFLKKQYWDFLFAMTEKEIKARYKFAILGFLWVILNPLLQMLVIGFIFQFFVPVKVDNYFLFLFAGLLPWNFFSMTVQKATPSIVFERGLIQKAKFPREAIVLSIVLSNLFHFLIALSLLILALVIDKIVFDHYGISQSISYIFRMLWLLPLLFSLTLLTSGFSLICSALNVKYRDVNFITQAILPLWFYATPLVYTLTLLPERFRIFYLLNPMAGIIELFHLVLLNLPLTSVYLAVVSLAMSIVTFLIGWILFQKESKFFDDWI